ncbi:protein arginine methyltransferase 4A [Euphorbia peplus]|nr:protein arginine methyltransferase 4A [Euphorbia peplus]
MEKGTSEEKQPSLMKQTTGNQVQYGIVKVNPNLLDSYFIENLKPENQLESCPYQSTDLSKQANFQDISLSDVIEASKPNPTFRSPLAPKQSPQTNHSFTKTLVGPNPIFRSPTATPNHLKPTLIFIHPIITTSRNKHDVDLFGIEDKKIVNHKAISLALKETKPFCLGIGYNLAMNAFRDPDLISLSSRVPNKLWFKDAIHCYILGDKNVLKAGVILVEKLLEKGSEYTRNSRLLVRVAWVIETLDKRIDESDAVSDVHHIAGGIWHVKMYLHCFEEPLHQQNLLQKYVETSSYYIVVLHDHVGCFGRLIDVGNGILSLIGAETTLGEGITIIEDKVVKVELPKKANILHSEPMGNFLVHDEFLVCYGHYEGLLKLKYVNINSVSFPFEVDAAACRSLYPFERGKKKLVEDNNLNKLTWGGRSVK